MKKRKIILTSLALAIVLVIGGIAAYLTDTTEQATNTFTVGKVDITLTEPSWNENNAKEIVPGQKIDKDPTITVANDSKDAYIFMKVTMPTGTVAGQPNTELFTLLQSDGTTAAPNAGWVEVTSASRDNVHVYAYGTDSAMTKVSKNGTATLFNKVQFKNGITSAEAKTLADAGNQNIVINAYAIQADGLDTSDPAEVWGLVNAA